MAIGQLHDQVGLVRVYGTSRGVDGNVTLRLNDRAVQLGADEFAAYTKLAEWLPTVRAQTELEAELGMTRDRLARFVAMLERAGVVYSTARIPARLTGEEFHRDYFAKFLPSWLGEAFSHPFWERMMNGKGSARLYTGWLFELYHYTRNANRHMPLSCAHTHSKPIKALRAKHYAEEWNHYHYFSKSLKALGFTEEDVRTSVPLPMTLALSNFMRQAAREDVLAYSICSAVLEGTTTDRGTYSPYYEKAAELYGIPRGAVTPIFAHLDLDVQYQHSDLFLEICRTVDTLSAERASLVLDYGHQLVEHIWMWTENIERYYEDETNPMPRRAFDPIWD
jgi:pyrroloquinoline quinone (PQQ) biosynthesis protein C